MPRTRSIQLRRISPPFRPPVSTTNQHQRLVTFLEEQDDKYLRLSQVACERLRQTLNAMAMTLPTSNRRMAGGSGDSGSNKTNSLATRIPPYTVQPTHVSEDPTKFGYALTRAHETLARVQQHLSDLRAEPYPASGAAAKIHSLNQSRPAMKGVSDEDDESEFTSQPVTIERLLAGGMETFKRRVALLDEDGRKDALLTLRLHGDTAKHRLEVRSTRLLELAKTLSPVDGQARRSRAGGVSRLGFIRLRPSVERASTSGRTRVAASLGLASKREDVRSGGGATTTETAKTTATASATKTAETTATASATKTAETTTAAASATKTAETTTAAASATKTAETTATASATKTAETTTAAASATKTAAAGDGRMWEKQPEVKKMENEKGPNKSQREKARRQAKKKHRALVKATKKERARRHSTGKKKKTPKEISTEKEDKTPKGSSPLVAMQQWLQSSIGSQPADNGK